MSVNSECKIGRRQPQPIIYPHEKRKNQNEQVPDHDSDQALIKKRFLLSKSFYSLDEYFNYESN
jgi:hypothetical protein